MPISPSLLVVPGDKSGWVYVGFWRFRRRSSTLGSSRWGSDNVLTDKVKTDD